MSGQALGSLLAAVLTLAVFSRLWRDNPVCRFVEQAFVGLSLAYAIAWEAGEVLWPKLLRPLLEPVSQASRSTALVALALCALALLRWVPPLRVASRVPLALMAGAFVALAADGALRGELPGQLAAALTPTRIAETGELCAGSAVPCDWRDFGSFALGVMLLVAVLVSFGSAPARVRPLGLVARLGRAGLVISLGATAGQLLSSRATVTLERLTALTGGGTTSLVAAIVVLALLAASRRSANPTT